MKTNRSILENTNYKLPKIYVKSGCSKFFPRKKISQPRVNFRSSRPQVFYKREIPKNFTKFIGKPLCWTLWNPAKLFSCDISGNFQELLFYRAPRDDCFWNSLYVTFKFFSDMSSSQSNNVFPQPTENNRSSKNYYPKIKLLSHKTNTAHNSPFFLGP